MMARFPEVFADVTKKGCKIAKGYYLPDGRYPIIDQGQDDIAGYWNNETGLYSDVPSIIFGDHTRTVKYIDTPCFLGADGVKLLKPILQNTNCKYLYYALCSAKIPNTGYNRHFKWLKEIDIPIPALETQIHIVAVLDKVCNLISLRKQQVIKLDELVKSRFMEMFGDPVSNPFDWETVSFASLGNCKNGMNFHLDDSGIEIHCLGVGDFRDLSIIADTTHLSKISLNEMPSDDYLLKDEDIVFVRSNGNKSLVGRSVAVYPHDVPTTFSGFCIRFRKNTNAILTDYLLHVLKTNSIRKRMMGRGPNIKNLSQQILSELIIPVPPLALQRQFSYFSSQTTKQKLTIQQSLDKLEVLKKALMQEYFR